MTYDNTKFIHDNIVSPPYQFTMKFIKDIFMINRYPETIKMLEVAKEYKVVSWITRLSY